VVSPTTLFNVAAVAAGGAVGSVLRYAISQWTISRFGPAVPWHTLAINVSGAFALGLLMAFVQSRGQSAEPWRLLLGVGLLGGYTTFSTFAFESLELLTQQSAPTALAYALGSVVAGVLAAWLGLTLGRTV